MDADGEQQETQHWLEIALDCKYVSKEETSKYLEKCSEIGRLLGGMMAKSYLFCKPTSTSIREDPPYFVTTND